MKDFENLVRGHHQGIIGLCRAMLHSDDAEDAAQEIFIKAYDRLDSYKGEAQFGTWLRRIAINHCLDLLRSRKRKPTAYLDTLPEHLLTEENRILPQAEAKEMLDALLADLPDDYRAVLVLRELEGLTYEEIAETLGITLDAVKSRLKRARESIPSVIARSEATKQSQKITS